MGEILQMKKYKLKPINSYYYYKQSKKKFKRVIIFLCISAAMILIGKTLCNFIIFSYKAQFKEAEPVYLDADKRCYDLYRQTKDIKGIYVPASKVNNYEDYIKLCKETQVNSIVIDIKNDSGYLTYKEESPDLVSKGCVLDQPPIKDIERVISRLYEEDIYPIARIVAFKDSVITSKEPERAVKDKEGNVYVTSSGDKWLDPYNKENWAYLLEISRAAAKLGFKEIQFDYIRFHESMDEDRVQLDQNVSKTEIITEFTKYICDNLKDDKVFVSADVFGTIILSDIDAETVGQDFAELSKHLDYICPMVYPSHYAVGTFGIEYPHVECYDIILRTMEIAQDRISENPHSERKAIIRPWLQDFTLKNVKPYVEYGPEQIKAQIKGVEDAGLKEWLFWNAAGKYTSEGLEKR